MSSNYLENMSILKDKYQKEVVPSLMEKLGLNGPVLVQSLALKT